MSYKTYHLSTYFYVKYKIKSNDQRQISDSHEFTFLTGCFFLRKKVPAKNLDPASQTF